MAQGDVENPNAWESVSDTLTVGAPAAPAPQGGLEADGGGKNGDPDYFIGSFTLQSVAPSLALGTVGTPAASGDVDAVYAVDDQQGSTLSSWSAVPPALATQVIEAPSGEGPIQDPRTWESAAPSLGVGALPAFPANGDVGEMYGWVEGEIRQFVWAQVAPTLGLGAIAPPTGESDIPNPFAWQDAVFFLTSQPYPLVITEAFSEANALLSGVLEVEHYTGPAETFSAGFVLLSGTFFTGMVPYSNWPPETFSEAGSLTAGTLIVQGGGVVTYSNWPPETFSEAATLTSGTLFLGLIQYTNWPAETFSQAGALTGGTLG